MFVIHTRDHGHPHVTIYEGNPERWEAMAKIRLDIVETIEVNHFSLKDMKFILKIVHENKIEWLEVWNDYRK